MRQIHRAGEKTFVDFAGDHPHLIDRKSGEQIEVELFVAVLSASNCTYAEATATQQSEEFIAAHTHMVEYFCGASAVVVPDQLKSGVSRPYRYGPDVQRTYQEWAEHYGTVVIPTRQRKPRDKAKVEVGVLVTERWILARLLDEIFFALADLNTRIAELLEDLNTRPHPSRVTARAWAFCGSPSATAPSDSMPPVIAPFHLRRGRRAPRRFALGVAARAFVAGRSIDRR